MKSQIFELVLTAREPISHHDPKTGNDSNTLTFLRQKQFVKREPSDTPVFRHLVERICEQNQMTETVDAVTGRLNMPEWLSAAYIRLLLDIHNVGDGDGLLSGMERYRMLENRLQTSATKCHSLHQLWSIITTELQLGMHAVRFDEQITAFWTLPPSIQYEMLTVMSKQHRAVSTIARLWHDRNKSQDQEYCVKAGKEFLPESYSVRSFTDDDVPEPQDKIVLNVPAISVNGLRHQLVREPAFLHLCDKLGIEPAARGEGELSVGAESIFYNGGNIRAGATQPSNSFMLAGEIRKAYPSLDLLGGVTSSFDIGESKLKMSAWIVCAENADNLPESLRSTAQAQTSVFEMLDTVTRTRMATVSGEGQMIYNYEVLVAGTQIYVELTLTPYTTPLTRGALAAALDYYIANDNIVGGQSARGHGSVTVERLTEVPSGKDEYETYLTENADKLRAGMTDGTLCSSAQVVK